MLPIERIGSEIQVEFIRDQKLSRLNTQLDQYRENRRYKVCLMVKVNGGRDMF